MKSLPARPSKLRFVVQQSAPLYGPKPSVDNPEKILDYWFKYIATDDTLEMEKENLIVVLVDTRLNAIGHHVVSVGSCNETTARIPDILCPAICARAYGFALLHNHPSGEPSPSPADERITRRVNEAAALMGIKFLEHLIVGTPEKYYSFRESGLVG